MRTGWMLLGALPIEGVSPPSHEFRVLPGQERRFAAHLPPSLPDGVHVLREGTVGEEPVRITYRVTRAEEGE